MVVQVINKILSLETQRTRRIDYYILILEILVNNKYKICGIFAYISKEEYDIDFFFTFNFNFTLNIR